MKKFISIFLSVLMMFSMSFAAYADCELQESVDEEITEYYSYTELLISSLSISSKTATCKSNIRGISVKATKIVVTQTLQKKNGNSWENITGWSKTFDTWYAVYTNSKSSLSSGTYRVKTSAKVYSGSNYETVTAYSTTVSC